MQFLRFRSAASHKFVTATVFISFFLPAADSISQTSQRTLSLDSRYFIHGYSNNVVGRFGIEMIQLGSLPASLIFTSDSATDVSENAFLFYDSRQLRNVGEGLTLLLGSAFLATGFHHAFHEYGHGTRLAASGWKPIYSHTSAGSAVHDNFISYYFSSFFDYSGYTYSEKVLFTPRGEGALIGWDGPISMGGINNSMLFVEIIEDELYRNGGHIGFAFPHAVGKLSGNLVKYGTLGDVRNIADYYSHERRYNIGTGAIRSASAASFFLSSMSYQFAFQLIRTFMGENPRFRPWEVYGVQLPNTQFYMNRDGLSYKVRSAYRDESWRFPIAVEYVFEGESRTELSIGAESQWENFSAMLQTIIGKKVELELELGYRFDEWFLLTGGYALYDVNNLHGERLIPSLEHGSTYHDAYLRVSLVY